MGKYQDLLSGVLDKIKAREGEEKMKKVFRDNKEESVETMSRELIAKLIANHLSPDEREEFLAQNPEFRAK